VAFLTGAGAPSSGLGSDGDSYFDQTNFQVYTKASGSWGSPTSLTGGIELGSATRTSDFTQTGVGNSDVTGLDALTVTVGTRPIKVAFDCQSVQNSDKSGTTLLNIKEDGTTIAVEVCNGPGNLVAGATTVTGIATLNFPSHREVRRAPSAGSHTYKVNLQQAAAGNSVIKASASSPALLQVLEC
jgi:hypothetical protein